MQQLNLANPRVREWYEAAAKHSDSGKCRNDETCPGCAQLERRRQELRAVPGLLVEA